MFYSTENNPYFWFTGLELPVQTKYLFEQLKKQDITIEQLRKELDNLNVPEEVQNQIQQMYDSGQLDEILDRIVNSRIDELEDMIKNAPAKITELPMSRRFRDIYVGRYTTETWDNDNFFRWALQGCCVYDRNGFKRMTGAFSGTRGDKNTDSDLKTNECRLVNYTYSNGTVDIYEHSQNFDWGHCNGMTYNPDDDRIYVVSGTRWSVGSTDKVKVTDRHIYRCDAYNFANPQSIEIPSMTYSQDIAYYNGKLYIWQKNTNVDSNNAYDICEVDWDNATISTPVSTIIIPSNTTAYNFDIKNGKVFCVCTNTRDLFVFDLTTGEFLWNYRIPLFDWSHRFRIPEIEGISVEEDGDVYIMTGSYCGYSSQAQTRVVSVFKGNYINNTVYMSDGSGANTDGFRPAGLTVTAGNVVFVVPSRTGIYNPDGTWENPFTNINEAVEAIDANPILEQTYVYICGEHRLQLLTSTQKHLLFCGRDTEGNYPESKYITLGGAYLQGCSRYTFRNIRFRNSTSNMYYRGRSGHQRGNICLYNSTACFYICATSTTENLPLGYFESPTILRGGIHQTVVTFVEGYSTMIFSANSDNDMGYLTNGTSYIGSLLWNSDNCNFVFRDDGTIIPVSA